MTGPRSAAMSPLLARKYGPGSQDVEPAAVDHGGVRQRPATNIAICSASTLVSAVAMAACTFSLAGAAQVDDGPTLIQFMPAGEFEPSDGRAMDVPAWRIDADSVRSSSSLAHHAAKGVLRRFRVRKVHRIDVLQGRAVEVGEQEVFLLASSLLCFAAVFMSARVPRRMVSRSMRLPPD